MKKNRKIFSLTAESVLILPQIVCAIIDVMSNPMCVYGRLDAPSSLIASGEALESTSLVFSDGIRIKKTDNFRMMPDIHGILFQNKRPAIVCFGELWDRCGCNAQMKSIMSAFVRLGYHGGLTFDRGELEPGESRGFECHIHLPESPSSGNPFLSLTTEDPDGFDTAFEIKITEICKQMGLPEKDPDAVTVECS